VRIVGNSEIPTEELQKLLTVVKGQEFVAETVEQQVAQVKAEYLARGFTRAQVMFDAPSLPPDSPDSSERRVEVVVTIEEGPRTIVRAVNFMGNTVFSASQLLTSIPVEIGNRYLAKDVVDGRGLIAIRYRNQGYLEVAVREATTFAENDTQADVTYAITEGRQAIVDQIIITGNDRTKRETILRELEIREGEPLSESAYQNSRTKLQRLGLFRGLAFSIIEHPGQAERDVLINVQEADRTTLGVGGGVEATLLAKPTGPEGVAEDTLEVAPRGQFEIGRRNLWGSRRSVNLFARVALRSTNVLTDDPADPDLLQSKRGFNEFRVIGTFRDPRLFDTNSELLVTASVEQAPRTSFNFARRIARAEVGRSLTPAISVAGRYSFEKTRLFDQIFLPEEGQLIDRLFPQIRLSKLAGTFIFDTRDDLLDPSTGRLVIVDTDLSLRPLGSEFGFVKTFAQGFLYHQLPPKRRMIVALGARVGLAHGFTSLEALDPELPTAAGNLDVDLLPASERFFAGGDTTVRGFSLDRLVNKETVAVNGFPIGGNSVVILNAELRSHLFWIVQGVGFVDAGNVFLRASDFGLIDVRPAAGFGIRLNTDFGPIRFDLGFNLNPQVFGEAPRESRTVFHFSIGQAF
jgi:outer membrane protein insertion porin family